MAEEKNILNEESSAETNGESEVKENKMGVLPVKKLIVSMSLPMMISMLVQALYNVVDSIFVAQVSKDALAAVTYAFPLQSMMIAVGSGTGVGINALLSKSLGEKNFERANKAANNGLNEAIVFSPLLEEHLRKHFPGMKITSSTCKQIEDEKELASELEKDYSLVVLDYNFNNNFDVLERLPHKEKAELLINPCCTPHCRRRGEHYRSIGRSQIKVTESLEKTGKICEPEPFECECMLKNLYQTVSSPLHISPDALYGRYAEMGYRNFKIEGRSVPDLNVLENYMYYMVKPEHRDAIRLEMTLRLTKNIKYF